MVGGEKIMAKIDDVISSLTTKIIELEKRETINVAMRIDDVIAYLEDVRDIANGAKQSQRFDLVESIGTGATIVYKVGNRTVTAGNDVLKYGDALKITVTPSTGYDIASFTINGENAVSGSTITVTENLEVVVTAALKTFDLTQTVGENCTVAYTIGGETVSAGTGVLTYGDTLVTTVTFAEGYVVDTFTINGDNATSPQSTSVTGDVAVVVSAQEAPTEP